MKSLLVAMIVVALYLPGFADWKYETEMRSTSGPAPQRYTIYVKGQRIRREFANSPLLVIRQCDRGQSIQIDTTNKAYSVSPLEPPHRSERTISGSAGCGSTVHLRQEVIETGEREQILGFDTRRILTRTRFQPEPHSCMGNADQQIVTDGWYIEQPIPQRCPSENDGFEGGFTAGGGDRYVREGEKLSSNLFPLKFTSRMLVNGQNSGGDITIEVTALTSESLDDSLFELPAGLAERSASDFVAGLYPERHYRSAGAPGTDLHPATSKSPPPGNQSGNRIYSVGPGIVAPKPIYHPEPSYTDAARKAKVSGTVVLSLTVTSQGSVDAPRVERSLRADLDEQALATVSTWRFEPGTKDGVPVPVRLNIEVSFYVR